MFDAVGGELLAANEPPRSGASQFNDTIIGIHEGLFAQGWLRWLYFVSGLLGSAVVATGLVLWTAKRLPKKIGERSPLGLRFVQRANCGVLLGIPIGIATYFLANRLIPVDFAARAAWEAHCLFIALLAAIFYASLREQPKAWRELAGIAAAAYVLIPVVNALTTSRHLGVSLGAGDSVMAGFDAAMLVTGIAFGLLSLKLGRPQPIRLRVREQPASSARPSPPLAISPSATE